MAASNTIDRQTIDGEEPLGLLETPGTIAIPTSEIGRLALFTISLAGTDRPPNTQLAMMASASVTQNLNQIIADMDGSKEWCWIVGDDHCWEPDCLMRMLAIMDEHPEIDILVPLVTKRNPPWHLVLFESTGVIDDHGLPSWRPLNWEEIPESGVFPIDAAGSAGMLIRRHVLDRMGYPWFESTGGVILNEDVHFCIKAREQGATIYATADVVMGHMGIFNVRPIRKHDRWGALTEFASPEQQFRHIFMPDVNPEDLVVHGR